MIQCSLVFCERTCLKKRPSTSSVHSLRLIGALTVVGISILMTVEVTELFTELRFSPHAVSFMTNDIILQRYIELEGRLRTVMTVIKARSRKHSNELRLYEITEHGIIVGDALAEYEGVITGLPRLRGKSMLRTKKKNE
jgi:circadian clock protein KaiC